MTPLFPAVVSLVVVTLPYVSGVVGLLVVLRLSVQLVGPWLPVWGRDRAVGRAQQSRARQARIAALERELGIGQS